MPDSKSRMEWHGKLKIGRREADVTGDPLPHLEVKKSKVKVTRTLNAVTENQLTNFKLGIPMEYDER